MKRTLLLWMLTIIVWVATAQTTTPVYHRVLPKETLYAISKKFNTTVDDLKRWNRLYSNDLRIGQQLIVGYKAENPKTSETAEKQQSETVGKKYHTVKPKETLYGISRLYNVTVADLKAWNNLYSNELKIGQQLIVGKEATTIEEDYAENNYQEEEEPVVTTLPPEERENVFDQYFQLVRDGNRAFNDLDYTTAKTSFEKAASLMPGEPYPKKKLAEIEVEMAKETTSYDERQFNEPEPVQNEIQTEPEQIEETPVQEDIITREEEEKEIETAPENIPEQQNVDVATIKSEKQKGVEATTYYAVMKDKPSEFGSNLAYLSDNTKVLVLEKRGKKYFKVQYNGREGWISARNIRKSNDLENLKRQETTEN